MIKLIPIEELKAGMFVEADVEVDDDKEEVRYFLAPRNAVYTAQSTKKARLLSSRYTAISAEGGLLITSGQYVETLRTIGVSMVSVDTDKSDRLLGLEELTELGVSGAAEPGDGGDDEETGQLFAEREGLRERQSFGSSGKGWMEVAIARDGLEARLEKMTLGGDASIDGDDFRDGLESSYGIRSGIDEDVVGEVVGQARAEPDKVISGDFTIARGQLPGIAQTGRVEYRFLDGVDRTKLDFSELKSALSERDLSTLLARKIVARVVVPGELLALAAASVPAKMGRDVHGNVVNAEPALRTGVNVEVRNDRFHSTIYGYACLLGNQLSTLSPIWMPPDRMEAYFIHFPRVGANVVPDREWLLELMDTSMITHGFDEAAIDKLCASLPPPDRMASLRLAKGIPPVRGDDVTVSYLFAADRETVAFEEDGSVDINIASFFPMVEKGQLLAEIIPPTVGEVGIDLAGRTVPSEAGSRELYRANEHVDLTYERGNPKYFTAQIGGTAGVFSKSLTVHALTEVEGDLDEPGGSIEVEGSLLVRGSVKAGCQVEASGCVAVLGMVEEGAEVRAHGNVVVAKGIVGANTTVVAAGKIETKLIQEATVSATGDVVVGSYLRDAQVRAGGGVEVKRGEGRRGGSIVGGEVFATTGMVASSIGSDTATTKIGIDPDPEIAMELEAAKKEVGRCTVHIAQIRRTLKLDGLEAEDFKAIIGRTPVPKRPKLIKVLRQLKTFIERSSGTARQRERLVDRMVATISEAEIAVDGMVYAGATVVMAEQLLTTDRDLEGVTFFTKPGVGQGLGYRQG